MKKNRWIVWLPIFILTLTFSFSILGHAEETTQLTTEPSSSDYADNDQETEEKTLPQNVIVTASSKPRSTDIAKVRASEISNITITVLNQNGFTIKDLVAEVTGVDKEDISPFVRVESYSIQLEMAETLSDQKDVNVMYAIEVPSDTFLGTYPLRWTIRYKDLYNEEQVLTDTFEVQVIAPNAIIGPFRTLMDYFNDWFGNYFWSILFLALLIKIIMYPLNVASMKSQAQMQSIQPRIKEINEIYKNEPQKKQEEIMKLYKEEKINPASGCLPLLPQLAVLMLLYSALQGYSPLYQASFLWIESLGRPDPYLIFPILAGASTFLQSIAMSQGQEQQNKMLTFLMPLIFFFIMRTFPAALSIFWTIFGILSWMQQYIYNKTKKTTSSITAIK